MPRKRGPRNKAKEVSYCTFKVPRDEDGNFILPPMRGWAERRRLMIDALKVELVKYEKQCRYRKNPSPRVIKLPQAPTAPKAPAVPRWPSDCRPSPTSAKTSRPY